MPVVELEISRLARLSRIHRDAILDALPYIGLDIESVDSRTIRAEYSPNRPDYATEYGIAQGLLGLRGGETGSPRMAIHRRGAYALRATPRAPRERPAVTAIAARGDRLGERGVTQLISMQEDLHAGIGRHRKISSIGLHNLDAMRFPLEYTVVRRDAKMVPLGSKTELTLEAILEKTDVGREYGALLETPTKMPAILDARGEIVSFPPIINSARTAISTDTRGIFVEVTGMDRRSVEDALSIVATTLPAAEFDLHEVRITGGRNSTPRLEPRKMSLDAGLVGSTIGVEMSATEVAECIRKSRIDATVSGKRVTCMVPRYRFDVLGEMDLVEEAVLGYGIDAIEPLLPPQASAGSPSRESVRLGAVSACMVGLGYTETLSSGLVGEDVHGLSDADKSSMIHVAAPKSRAHTILRDSLVPGLLGVLSRNVHEAYPQRLFETGTTFARAEPVIEHMAIAGVTAHAGAGFTEAKSVASAVMRLLGRQVSTSAAQHAPYADGHSADITVDGVRVGTIGDVRADALERLRIREAVAAFEIDLDALPAAPGSQKRQYRRRKAAAAKRPARGTKARADQ